MYDTVNLRACNRLKIHRPKALWALNGDLDRHHRSGDHLNPLLFHFYYHLSSIQYTAYCQNSNRLENCLLSRLTWTDLVHAIVRPTDFSLS